MSKELAKTYDPKGIEERLYQKWMDNGYFHAKVNPDKKPFTIVMPPPNVTGQLHMGHALDETMQDILIRFKRMQGYEALWQPGTDHAAIATEVKVTEKLKKEGIDKAEIGREKFLEYAWECKLQYLYFTCTDNICNTYRYIWFQGCFDYGYFNVRYFYRRFSYGNLNYRTKAWWMGYGSCKRDEY